MSNGQAFSRIDHHIAFVLCLWWSLECQIFLNIECSSGGQAILFSGQEGKPASLTSAPSSTQPTLTCLGYLSMLQEFFNFPCTHFPQRPSSISECSKWPLIL
ncbi:hypothetical protein PanWU01x14_075420 [Parasponia andersonii]|uniref:Uncharacterized protein n=1 Tax=Parasponia andersonii TaxID=3476 RepID=A0A2P5DCU4_PARAD|nr:hypothetical protein PanWU01x14_075420 [Parasponia andersonii]